MSHGKCVQALEESGLPKKLRMVVMCNKPSFEFRAFQVQPTRPLASHANSFVHMQGLPVSLGEGRSAILHHA